MYFADSAIGYLEASLWQNIQVITVTRSHAGRRKPDVKSPCYRRTFIPSPRPKPKTGPRAALLRLLARKSFRLGEFKLSSGGTSDYYIDCRSTTLDAKGSR